MGKRKLNITFYLSVVATILAGVAAGIGLFNTEIYHDNSFVKTAWYANDWVTLVVVIPLLIIVLITSKNGDFKFNFIMLGLISYLFYTYAFYLFGAAFNDMFLLYIAIYATSFFAIITSLISFPVKNIIATSKILRGISVFLILISVMLCVVEVPPCFTFITKGTLPQIILKSQIQTSIVYALDLSFVVPVMFFSGSSTLAK